MLTGNGEMLRQKASVKLVSGLQNNEQKGKQLSPPPSQEYMNYICMQGGGWMDGQTDRQRSRYPFS